MQYLNSEYPAAENTCFCLFRAATAEAVRVLNDEASFVPDRIAEARVRTSGTTVTFTPIIPSGPSA